MTVVISVVNRIFLFENPLFSVYRWDIRMLNAKEKLNLPSVEEAVLAFWKDKDIFKKSVQMRAGGTEFVFYEGPPTANARPMTHHMIGRAFKDIIPRYKQMRGYHVPRRAGWDTHGLPVEIEIEKELGIKSKPEIERYGIAEFNAKAKASVWKYKEEWERLTERIGFWLDMEHPYITYDNAYVEKIWSVLKKVNERGLLYKGHKVVPWCTRCGTALSSHELAQGYKEVTDASVYVSFKITDGAHKDAYIVAWTTTPWTLLGNVALAVNPTHTFVTIPDAGKVFVLEKNAAVRMKLPIEKEFSAQELVGLSYEPLFDVPALKSEKSHKIYPADFVATESGTGVVHTAVMYGEDDYALGAEVGLPMAHTVDEAGNFTDAVPAEFKGLRAKNATTEEKIIAHIKDVGRLLMTEPYSHEYPFCWRCQTPVIYYATDAWFIAMSKLRAELAVANAQVNWTPAHIKDGRFGEWVNNAKDWALSRARYWGTPLPVWECAPCNVYTVVGSLAELPEQPKDAAGNVDVHRPFIDKITLSCEKCGGVMPRVKDVIDVWFDSGAMPFASNESPSRYPADYICEGIDQTRGWFYTLMAIGVLMEQGAPYKNVVCYSHLLDKLGKKMSKTKGNGVDPWELVAAHGADAVRWHFYSSAIIKEAQKFNERDFGKGARSFISLIYNSFVFLQTYGNDTPLFSGETKNILDKWVVSRLHETARDIAAHLDAYEIAEATQTLEVFADDLSRWYLRRSRKRAEALPVLRYVLLEMSKLIAPFMPFFAEALYKSLDGEKESVHMEDWLKVDESLINKTLMNGMAEIRRLASIALAARAEAGIKIRQPLTKLAIRLNEPAQMLSEQVPLNVDLLSILADEVNVKEVLFDEKIEKEIALDTVITPELERDGIYRDLVRMAQGLRQSAKCSPNEAVVFHVEAGEKARTAIEEMQTQFLKDTNAKEILFTRTDKFVAEATEEIGGASAWMGIVS